MELYILSKQDLSILSIAKVSEYQINLDEETNAKSTFVLMKTEGLKKDNFLVLNGLYRQFLFIIDDVQTEKGSNVSTVTALDISNIFDRKVIEKNTSIMTSNSIEQFIANTMSENFVNSSDLFLNIGYIDIYWHTNTQASVATNVENGLYNFHTFLTNCRQYKNIYTDFKFENGRLKIDIENKTETTELIDTTLPEVTDYNKIYEDDITAKVTVLIREDNSEYNLYLKTDRTTTTNVNDPDRASGKIEVISVDTSDMAAETALNVMKGNNYKHLVEFKIAKTSQLMNITKLHIGRPIRIKTDDDIYDSYISAITLTDENFVYFKSGSLRNTLIDKLKANQESVGNKLDISGGTIKGTLNVAGNLKHNGTDVINVSSTLLVGTDLNTVKDKTAFYYCNNCTNRPISTNGYLFVQNTNNNYVRQEYTTIKNEKYIRTCDNGTWYSWVKISTAGITESGNNTNGSYVKFDDGTMICRFTIPKSNFLNSTSYSTTVQNIKIYRSNTYDWTFPESFIDTNIQINISIANGTGNSRLTIPRIHGGNMTKSLVQIQLLGLEDFISTGAGFTNLTNVQITAIGRWK